MPIPKEHPESQLFFRSQRGTGRPSSRGSVRASTSGAGSSARTAVVPFPPTPQDNNILVMVNNALPFVHISISLEIISKQRRGKKRHSTHNRAPRAAEWRSFAAALQRSLTRWSRCWTKSSRVANRDLCSISPTSPAFPNPENVRPFQDISEF